MNYLAVFVGGGLGSICRYAIARIVSSETTFPYATLIANSLSCIVLGFFVFYFAKNSPNEALKVLLLVGFCGGFSTFSTFSLETMKLVETGDWFLVLANILGNILLCALCLFIGSLLAERFF